MKRINLLALIAIVTFTLFNCKSKKSIAKVNDMTEIKIPLSGKEYETNKDYFRAKQVGVSPDLATAKKIAEQNAKAELAGNIQSLVKRVTDQYTNQRTVQNKVEFKNKFEELSRQVVNQELKNVKVIGERLFEKKDGKYQYWVAVESAKETVYNEMVDKISKEAKLKLDFDKFQYEKIFDAEMKKFEEQKNGE